MEIVGRAALSLQFEDEELYNGLIAPLKAGKRLSPLVMQLLELYYYNEEFHNMAEQLSPSENENIADNYDDYFKDISAFIAVMGNMQDTLEDNVKDGLKSIIETSDERDIDTEVWGKAVPRVSDRLATMKEENVAKDTNKQATNTESTERIQELENNVKNLSSTVEELMLTIKQQNAMQMQPYIVQGYPQQFGNMQYMQNVQMSNMYGQNSSTNNNPNELEKILNGEPTQNDKPIRNENNEVNVTVDTKIDEQEIDLDSTKKDLDDDIQIKITSTTENENKPAVTDGRSSLNKLLKSVK